MVDLRGRNVDHGVPKVRMSGDIRHVPLRIFTTC